jgi:hypothetical protein
VTKNEESQRPRKNPRTPLSVEVQLRRSGHHHYLANVYDVWPDGCRLEFVERPRLDETVWIKFDGLDAIQSTVCWTEGFEVGVEFATPFYPAVFEALVARLTRS